MIQRFTYPDGLVVYQSLMLLEQGFPHAFSTRLGGISRGPFESLNLGNPSEQSIQDSTENISENYRRLQKAIGCESRRRYLSHQVHGSCVVDTRTSTVTDTIHGGIEIGQADALSSDDPETLVSVRVADCVPVLLADRITGQVAAVHAGWRGVIAGVVLEALKRFNRPSNVLAAIGPSISIDAFEVGIEVFRSFESVFGRNTPGRPSPRGPDYAHLDLRQCLILQMLDVGVPDKQIDLTDRCTFTHAREFFSHRRDNGLTGRMAAIIGARS